MPIPKSDRHLIQHNMDDESPKISYSTRGLAFRYLDEHPAVMVSCAESNYHHFALELCLYHGPNSGEHILLPFQDVLPTETLFELCTFDLCGFGQCGDGNLLHVMSEAVNAALNTLGKLTCRRRTGGLVEIRLQLGDGYFSFIDFDHPSAATFNPKLYFTGL